MNLSKKWLNDYVELDVSDKQFADDMTISGSKVEGFEKEGEELVNIVVGKVESLERHPDSDHLWICQINVGKEENLQIVTGASNVYEGAWVPLVLDGGRYSTGVIRLMVDFLQQCVDTPRPLDASNQAWLMKEIFGLLSILSCSSVCRL